MAEKLQENEDNEADEDESTPDLEEEVDGLLEDEFPVNSFLFVFVWLKISLYTILLGRIFDNKILFIFTTRK